MEREDSQASSMATAPRQRHPKLYHASNSFFARCPSCQHRFDSHCHQMLIGACNHARCYTCVVSKLPCHACGEKITETPELARRLVLNNFSPSASAHSSPLHRSQEGPASSNYYYYTFAGPRPAAPTTGRRSTLFDVFTNSTGDDEQAAANEKETSERRRNGLVLADDFDCYAKGLNLSEEDLSVIDKPPPSPEDAHLSLVQQLGIVLPGGATAPITPQTPLSPRQLLEALQNAASPATMHRVKSWFSTQQLRRDSDTSPPSSGHRQALSPMSHSISSPDSVAALLSPSLDRRMLPRESYVASKRQAASTDKLAHSRVLSDVDIALDPASEPSESMLSLMTGGSSASAFTSGIGHSGASPRVQHRFRLANGQAGLLSVSSGSSSFLHSRNSLDDSAPSALGHYRRPAQNRRSYRLSHAQQAAPSSHTESLASVTAFSAASPALTALNQRLAPMTFEIPCLDEHTPFVGRDWLFHELYELIINESPSTADVLAVRGAVVYGAPGCGKTAVAYKLASRSPLFQPASSAPGVATLRPDPALSSDSGFITSSRLSMSQPSPDSSSGSSLLDFVASRVVAFHFCQVDSENTCSLPGFLRSLIASLIAAPQLRFYGEYLAKHRDLCDLLDSETALLSDPLDVFRRVLVEPLKSLRKRNKIPARQPNLVILLDGIADAEYHRSESGDSILTFVTRHFKELPVWLRCIVTVRSSALDHLRGMSLHKVGLENLVVDERLYRDVEEYIAYRIRHSPSILANISPHGAEQPLDPGSLARFVDHLASLSKGNFLYLKLTLNLIERSHLIVKSTSYKVLPISLCEVFLLLFNLKFPIISVFERVTAILNTCLASLRPLKARELFDVVRHTHSDVELGWEEFCDRLLTLSEFVVQRSDDTFVLFHPAFREWLIRREETESSKFLCNQRYGHFLIAQSTALQSAGLSSVELLELGHHILKAHIYKSLSKEMRNAVSSRDAQAYWVAIAAENVRTALLSAKNIFSPNTKVSRLLLLAGADPELPTDLFNQAPLLGVAARLGHTEMVALLLEFGADPCCTGSDGCAPLMQAALMGHIDVVQLLHQHGAKLSQIDGEDCCALVYAARSGHVTLCSFLLQCDWSREVLGGEMTSSNESGAELGQMGALKRTAQQQAFVAAASKGQTQVCKFFLEFGEVLLDESDAVSGETALSLACLHGHKDTVQFLLSQGGAISYTNTDESATPPLISAVCGGCWEIVSTLLARGLDVDAERSPVSNSTPLMLAAAHGHIGVVELLLSRDAAVNAMDLDGRTALAHACLQGQQPSATLLLDRGAQIDASDHQGRTPLHHAASGGGDRHLISLLLDRGAPLERPDSLAHRPLEVAIAMNNVDAVVLFLRRGAKLSAATWQLATHRHDIMLILLNKLLDDGNLLYKKDRLKDSAVRYQYAMKRLPATIPADRQRQFMDVKHSLLLNFARCKRRSGEPQTAVDLIDRAIPVRPQSFEAYYVRARAYKDLDKPKLALLDVSEALRLSPENREARQLLAKLQQDLQSEDNTEAPRAEPECALSDASLSPAPRQPLVPVVTTDHHDTSSADSGHAGDDCQSPALTRRIEDSQTSHPIHV